MFRKPARRPTCEIKAARPPKPNSRLDVDDRWIEDLDDELGCLGLSSDEIPAVRDELGLMDPTQRGPHYHDEIAL